eukprot:2845236-Prorocentrum_lima.AAC.1
MTSSLVGSEMCIRDRWCTAMLTHVRENAGVEREGYQAGAVLAGTVHITCLLYTSDAADDM